MATDKMYLIMDGEDARGRKIATTILPTNEQGRTVPWDPGRLPEALKWLDKKGLPWEIRTCEEDGQPMLVFNGTGKMGDANSYLLCVQQILEDVEITCKWLA